MNIRNLASAFIVTAGLLFARTANAQSIYLPYISNGPAITQLCNVGATYSVTGLVTGVNIAEDGMVQTTVEREDYSIVLLVGSSVDEGRKLGNLLGRTIEATGKLAIDNECTLPAVTGFSIKLIK